MRKTLDVREAKRKFRQNLKDSLSAVLSTKSARDFRRGFVGAADESDGPRGEHEARVPQREAAAKGDHIPWRN